MSITLNGRTYTDEDFKGYGYVSRFPGQIFADLLAELELRGIVRSVLSVNGQVPDGSGDLALSIPSALSGLAQDSNHRTVTDAEKSSWSGKGTVKSVNSTTPDASGNVVLEIPAPTPAQRAAAGEVVQVVGYAVGGVPDAATQAAIDALLADGWPEASIWWRYLGESTGAGSVIMVGGTVTPVIGTISAVGGVGIQSGHLVLPPGNFTTTQGLIGITGILVGTVSLAMCSFASSASSIGIVGINAGVGVILWNPGTLAPAAGGLSIAGQTQGLLALSTTSVMTSLGTISTLGLQVGSLVENSPTFQPSLGVLAVTSQTTGAISLGSGSFMPATGAIYVLVELVPTATILFSNITLGPLEMPSGTFTPTIGLLTFETLPVSTITFGNFS